MAQPWVLSYRNPEEEVGCMLAPRMYMDRLSAAVLQSAERGNLAMHRVHTRCSLHTLQQLSNCLLHKRNYVHSCSPTRLRKNVGKSQHDMRLSHTSMSWLSSTTLCRTTALCVEWSQLEHMPHYALLLPAQRAFIQAGTLARN